MEEFFKQGLMHPLLTTSHMVLAIGLGILLGQQKGPHLKGYIAVFLAILVASAFLTRVQDLNLDVPFISLIVAALIGVLIALKLRWQEWVVYTLSIGAGFLVGQESAPVMIPGIKAMTIYAFFVGAALTTTAILTVTALIAIPLGTVWNGIILRVLGSWVVASALMVQFLMLSQSGVF